MSKIDLTEDQKERLGIKDERVDFYFKKTLAIIYVMGYNQIA